MTRLDTQRPPVRAHVRKNKRWYIRGYDTKPHEVWGDTKGPNVGAPPATGATAGTPGSWTPAGSLPPANLTDLMNGVPNVVTASPTSAWTGLQFVQTRTAGNAGRATWTGTAWVGFVPTVLTSPGDFTIVEVQNWVDANPDDADEVLAAEEARSTPRVTLVEWLQGFISHRDEGTIP